MAWRLGSELPACDQQRVLGRFARSPQFPTDADWLAHTRFRVNGKGRLDGRARNCYSLPSMATLSFTRPRDQGV